MQSYAAQMFKIFACPLSLHKLYIPDNSKMFLDSFTKPCTRDMWGNGNGCLETHMDLPHCLGVKGSVWAASSCRVTKAHTTCSSINMWEGKVAVASPPSIGSL